MKLNRKWIMVLALVMSMAMATTGTLAYLTDRDSEANVFTMGNVEIDLNEEFDPDGAELIPGLDITKKPTITNTGKNDAWVWATIAIPSKLDSEDASKNIVHFNYSKASVEEGLWSWMDDVKIAQKIDDTDILYNVYTVLYNTALQPGETTAEPVMTKVYMDDHIDIDPEGNVYHVEGGVVTGPYWNVNTDGNPIIYVSAYAIQTEGFATVEEGYAAYNAQWGDKGAEYGEADNEIDSDIPEFKKPNGDDDAVTYPVPAGAVKVANNAELDAAIKSGATVLELTGEGPYIIPDSAQGKTLTIAGNGQVIATQDDGSYEGCDYSLDGSTVTFLNVSINTDSTTYTGYARCNATYNNCVINGTYTLYGTSEFNYCTLNVTGDIYNIWTWGATDVKFDHCTFNTSGKSILVYGNNNTTVHVTNCVFNDADDYADVNNKAAIEVGSDWAADTKTIIAENVDVYGFDITNKGTCTESTLWGNKNSLSTERLSVTIDGEKKY